MTIKIAINGFGRIGRIVFRMAQKRSDIKVVAINDLLTAEYMAYMLKYDSTHGLFNEKIIVHDDMIIINKEKIYISSEKNPKKLMWKDLNIDVVIESTGIFLTQESAYNHIISGAKKVIITSPPKDDTPMFVNGVNFNQYAGQKIVSNVQLIV